MGISSKRTPPVAASAPSASAKAATSAAKLAFRRARKGSNLSRKEVLDFQRKVSMAKEQEVEAKKRELKKQASATAQHRHNKKVHREFDRDELQCVQEGLINAITALGAPQSPLSLFMCAQTALSKAADGRQIPYLLSIMTVCVPRLSQGVLQSQLEELFALLEQVTAEHSSSNALIMTKSMMLAQMYLLTLERPDKRALDKGLKRLEPNKGSGDAMAQYAVTWRKVLESAALSTTSAGDLNPPKSATGSGDYILEHKTLFFLHALPSFVDLCIGTLAHSPFPVAVNTFNELKSLFSRAISPYIVESVEGRETLNAVLASQILNLFKAHYQPFWAIAAELVEVIYDRLSYIKRTSNASQFTAWFPSSGFLVKVLNKIRHQEDGKLNGKVERAMISIGKGMPMAEFVDLVPLDPSEIYNAEKEISVSSPKEYATEMGELWANSYFLGVVRRAASHDSLPFFVKHYYPHIQFCMRIIAESEKAKNASETRLKWSALLLQYWRVCVGFCHYPKEVTKDSFRDLAKQLVSLLSQAQYVDTAATAIHVLCDGYYQLSQAVAQDDDDVDDGVVRGSHGADQADEVLPDDERGAAVTLGKSLEANRRMKGALEEDDYYLSMNDPGWNPHKYHNISQSAAKDVCENIFAVFSSNIMPKLCNVFETHDSSAVLFAIQSFSKVCTKDVMKVILQGILTVGTNISREGREKITSNTDEGGSVPAKAGSEPLTSKRRMILDLACVVVGQVSTEHLTQLFEDVVEPVLSDPAPTSRLLQKKAYKLLYSMFEQRVKDIFPLFPRIAALLAVGQQYVTISGVRMRIRCLSWALDACKMFCPEQLDSIIRGGISEVILFARERSSGARELAMEMLEKMQRYIVSGGGAVNTLLHLVIAALSGKTPMMMSCALVCMAKVLHMTHDQLQQRDLDAAISIGFRMLESSEPEVRTAATTFSRMTLKLMKRSDAVRASVLAALPKLLFGIALITSQTHVSSTARMQLRVLLSKCIKRFGYDKIDPIFPIGSKKFLIYTYKLHRREEKREEYKLKKRTKDQANEFEHLFLNTAIKSSTSNADSVDLLQEGGLSQFVATHTEATTGFAHSNGHSRYGHDDDDDADGIHLEITNGKLRILTQDEKKREDETKRRKVISDRLQQRNKGLLAGDAINDTRETAGRSKRSRDEEQDFENDELVLRYGSKTDDAAVNRAMEKLPKHHSAFNASATHGARGAVSNQLTKLRDQKEVNRQLKRQRVEEDIRKGEEFVGKGQGDIKKGNVEPFAYVPLNRRFMNRRHQRHALQRFEAVSMKALKGNKAKAAFDNQKK